MAVILCMVLAAVCAVLGVWVWTQRKSLRSAARQLEELERTDSTARLRLAVPNRAAEDLLEQVNRLPQKYRQVLYLRYYEDYEVHEIAALLGQSPALVSTHLARAKAKLRQQLGGNCYDG